MVEAPGSSAARPTRITADVIGSIYYAAWTPPDDAANDDAITKVSVTIASDGTVVSARIVTPSGDARVDNFHPAHAWIVSLSSRRFRKARRKKNGPYIINFNLKAKRMLG